MNKLYKILFLRGGGGDFPGEGQFSWGAIYISTETTGLQTHFSQR